VPELIRDTHLGLTPPSTATPSTPGIPALGGVEAGARPRAGIGSWVRLLRPRQWTKNAFVLAPLLVSGRALSPGAEVHAALAFITFSLLASSVYVFNDIVDCASDRAHPVKRRRPIASGEIPVGQAVVASVLLLGAALGLSVFEPRVLPVSAAYLAINVLYTFRLKHVVIVDVFAVASFFVLRLLAGAAAVDVVPSVWLLLCGGLLALFLGFAKRRHELLLLGDGSRDHRVVLSQYTMPLLDQLSVVLLSVTVVSYIMYTLTSKTAALVGSEALSYSTVFVLYGVFRYLYLVHRREGGDPAETLLTDRSLLTAVVLWFAYCAFIVYR
jgi:4-hydroxybenzoate polyprenyltransferase